MKKKRITYGVAGMMEYQAVIKVGRSQMRVVFTDGSATGYGMNPAMYTTDSLMVQNAIDNSDDFKRGRIHIVDSVELDEEVSVVRNDRRPMTPTPESLTETEAAAQNEADVESEAMETETVTVKAETPTEEKVETVTEMEFDNNDDAKDYLEQTFGCVRSKLRNRADIIAAGTAYGVSISFT